MLPSSASRKQCRRSPGQVRFDFDLDLLSRRSSRADPDKALPQNLRKTLAPAGKKAGGQPVPLASSRETCPTARPGVLNDAVCSNSGSRRPVGVPESSNQCVEECQNLTGSCVEQLSKRICISTPHSASAPPPLRAVAQPSWG